MRAATDSRNAKYNKLFLPLGIYMILKPAHLLVVLLASAALPAMAQNLAVVNGKPVPTSRSDLM
ncbi:MAG TPA: hypothetical protein VGO72_05800, partial [Herminiimonas sp.]|nr:hypothetical protein [Herminiimonas sp.]